MTYCVAMRLDRGLVFAAALHLHGVTRVAGAGRRMLFQKQE